MENDKNSENLLEQLCEDLPTVTTERISIQMTTTTTSDDAEGNSSQKTTTVIVSEETVSSVRILFTSHSNLRSAGESY